MRFLFLTQYFPPEVGAPQVRLAAVIRELRRLGHEVEVVTCLPNYPTGQTFPEYRRRFYVKEVWEGVTIHRVWSYPSTGAGAKRIANYVSFTLTSMLGLARAKRPDFLFVESPPLTVSLPGVFFARLWGASLIFNVADLWPDSVREMGLMRDGMVLRAAARLERWTYARAAYVNAVTEGIRRTLIDEKNVPVSKVLFFPNGVDVMLFRPREPDDVLAQELGLDGKQVIVYAGTLGLAQGLDVALDAMSNLKVRLPNAVLVFLGSGSDKKRLEARARACGLDNVRFLDPRPPEFVARIYSIACSGFASLKALPILDGARPSKLFPIMASGKPVLFSGSGEAKKLLEDAGAGIVTPPEDAVALAGAIERVLTDGGLADQLGRNGRRFVERSLSWPAVIADWISQLRQREGSPL